MREEGPVEPPGPALGTDELRKEEFIIAKQVSERRVDAFLESFLEHRRQTATTESIFKRVGAFTAVHEWNDSVAYGFNVLLLKGPFVEGSNWAPYYTWQFALAAERHLLGRLEALLRESASVVDEVHYDWPEILATVDRLSDKLASDAFHASVIVLAGPMETDFAVDLHKHATPDWELGEQFRSPWIMGAYNDKPIVIVREAESRALYVVDLAEFATLTKYGRDAELHVHPIDEARAREVLAEEPQAITIPEGGPNTLEERIRQLQLRVWVRLYESYDIEVRNPIAVKAAGLATS